MYAVAHCQRPGVEVREGVDQHASKVLNMKLWTDGVWNEGAGAQTAVTADAARYRVLRE